MRVWQQPRVKVGGRYRLGDGHLRVTSLREIVETDVTEALARRSGFADTVDLFATARHGRGDLIYLIEFEYEGPEQCA